MFGSLLSRIRKLARPVVFDTLFWVGLWLPFAVFPFLWSQLFVALVFSSVLAALADAAGSRRRYFYLGAGLILAIVTIIAVAFMATSGLPPNGYSMLTAGNYAVGGGNELSYVVIRPRGYLAAALLGLPFTLLALCWSSLDWKPSRRRQASLAAALLLLLPSYYLDSRFVRKGGAFNPTDQPPPAVRADGLDQRPHLPYPLSKYVPLAVFSSFLQYLKLRQALEARGSGSPPIVPIRDKTPLTLVVIVRESASRRHMGIYGYCRDTTPDLRAMGSQLTLFRNVVSEVPLTIFALSRTLILRGVQTKAGKADVPAVGAFNAAGFDTYWMSNQFDYGLKIDAVTLLADAAQHRAWMYRRASQIGGGGKKDAGRFWPRRGAGAQAGGKKVIFLHTLGTHVKYIDRYPPGFGGTRFAVALTGRNADQAFEMNAYDTAVRYVDSFIADVIHLVSRTGRDAAVVYFSDHGEELFDDVDQEGHNYPGATRDMVEIPLVVWLSPSLRAAYPGVASELARAQSEPMGMGTIAPLQ